MTLFFALNFRKQNKFQITKCIKSLNSSKVISKQCESDIKYFLFLKADFTYQFQTEVYFVYKQMKILQNFKKILQTFDLFCSSELLRYNEGTQYKTITGGVLSLGIIIVITLGFSSMISNTFDKTSITSDISKTKQTDPTPINLIANAENNFMLSVAITSMDIQWQGNLSSTPRYFDVKMRAVEVINGVIANVTDIKLEQCTKQHWSMIPYFHDNFELLGANSALCLPIGYVIPLQGSYSSPIYSLAQIQVFTCQNQTANDTCAPQADIDALFDTYGNFIVDYIYANPVINPNEPDFISYYLQENDYTIFSKIIGSQTWVQFTDFTINTDNSLLPFTNILTTTGSIIEGKSFNHPCTSINNLLASIYLAKSHNSLVYKRQVQKISAVFSYIGGLVGAVTAFLFMIKAYTDCSLQVTIGLNLFEYSKQEKEPSGFNVLSFIKLNLYRLLKLFKWKGQWKEANTLEAYQEEAVKQLDINLLLKRLYMLQACMDRLVPKDQAQRISSHRITVNSAKKMRTFHVKKENIQVEQFKEEDLNEMQDKNTPLGQQASWFNMLGKQKLESKEEGADENHRKHMKTQRDRKHKIVALKLNDDLYVISGDRQTKTLKNVNSLNEN